MAILPHRSRRSWRRRFAWVVIAGVFQTVAWSEGRAHPPDRPAPAVDPTAEAAIHTPAGFAAAGKPRVFDGTDPARLRVTVVDRETGQPTFCRVNVVGPDGHYYEPRENALAPWSLHRTGNRPGKGPFRYYGWFFYTSGRFQVEVPPGASRVEVWKGYEYRPLTHTVTGPAGATTDLTLELDRTAPLAGLGYYSGDTHVHLPRRDATDDARALDLMAAEDIQYGSMLCFNADSRTYTGSMANQLQPQLRGFGPPSVAGRGPHAIASGQEYVTSAYGHICLLLHDRLVLDRETNHPNEWPPLGLLGVETRTRGGYSIHAHGGYALEIYADFAQRVTDGVELLQFAEYRGIALEGWYRMLNIGHRFPGVGACDYPFCRALGDCRTYVSSPTRPTFVEWTRRAAEGRSFFTTGPLLLLEVDGSRPGDVIRWTDGASRRVRARVRLKSEVAPVSHVELIVNGRSALRRPVPSDRRGGWFALEHEIELREPAWIAARTWSDAPPGKPDAEAHTNPVYVVRDGRLPYREADLDWLVQRIDERLAAIEKLPDFPRKRDVLDFFRKSRGALLEIRQTGGQSLKGS